MLVEDALFPWRKKAYDRYLFLGAKLSLPEPAVRGAVDLETIKSALLPDCSPIVFVDGQLDLTLSTIPKGVICLPLDVALKSYGLFLQNRWVKQIDDPLLALNTALGQGAFIYICGQCPTIQILHVSTSDNLLSPRIQVTLGKSVSATFIQTYLHLGQAPHSNASIDLALEANAHLQLYDLGLMPKQSWFNTMVRATQKKDSSLKVFHATDGSRHARFSATTELLEENSAFEISALVMLSEDRKADIHVLVDHAAPHCTSRQMVKMVLNDQSRSNFEGKIYVRQAAQKTEAYQLNNNLILSETATAVTQPNLEIFADDVKASHGATVAQLSEEELFYLRARGIPLQQARALLTHAFCKQLIDTLPVDSFKQPLLDTMARVLHA